jgi:hypothetical protein
LPFGAAFAPCQLRGVSVELDTISSSHRRPRAIAVIS